MGPRRLASIPHQPLPADEARQDGGMQPNGQPSREAAVRGAPKAAAPPQPCASVPRPISAPGAPRVSYLSDEKKEVLNRKYGRIMPPSAADIQEIAVAGASCKLQ